MGAGIAPDGVASFLAVSAGTAANRGRQRTGSMQVGRMTPSSTQGAAHNGGRAPLQSRPPPMRSTIMKPSRCSLALALALAAPLAAQSTICHSAFDTPNYNGLVSTGGPNLLIAIKTQVAGAVTATRIEVFTGNQSGQNTVAIWSHDAANNRPLALLGSGAWAMGMQRGWQGANLTTPVPLAAATDCWIVWGCVDNSQSSVEGQGAGAQQYRGSFDGGATWSGPFQSWQWKFRVYCGGPPGHYEVFGNGCAGSNRLRPVLGWNGLPNLGASLQVTLDRGIAGSGAILTTGFSNTLMGTVNLPYDLAPRGAPGCLVLSAIESTSFVTIDAAGRASSNFAIPSNVNLQGLPFYNQWFVLDQAANVLGLTASNGGAGTVGA
jgi:hypothetical protein